jgi:hypothetical protein
VLDLRYHVASLSAVFLALIVGILVGVGISGRGFVDKSERRTFENRIAALQSQVDKLGAQKDLLSQQGEAERSFAQDTYPALMHDRLLGKRIALIVVGSTGGAATDVRQALADAGATVSLYRVLKLPVSAPAIRQALVGTPGFRRLQDVGHELAQEWVSQGLTPISDSVSTLVVEEQRGAAGRAVDGVTILEGTQPSDAPSTDFLTGFFDGLSASSVPLVGAEKSDTATSNVAQWSRVSDMSTVDDVDTPSGKLALALLLAGAPGGHFGVKAAADAALPRVAPVG